MKHTLTLVLVLFAWISHAQTKSIQVTPPLSEGTAASVGMSGERLMRIENMCREAVKNGEVPGMVALVARKGKVVFHKAFGTADFESKRAFQTNDIFRIASQTKAITATAVMMLWEEGKFRLDDPIAKFIPEFANVQVLDSLIEADSSFTTTPAKNQITIRHLLTHTSGVGYGFIDSDERFKKMYQKAGIIDGFTTRPVVLEENIKKLAGLPIHQNPGEKYVYSEGLDVLGYMIEIVSGMPLDKFFKTRIFDPLGMKDTWFYQPKSNNKRLVPVYMQADGKWQKLTANPLFDPDYPITGAKTYFAGGAGLSSTAMDYARFLQMYLNEGEVNGIRLLSRTTVQAIMSNQIGDLWKGSGAYYGLAFGVLNEKGQAQGGRGSAGTFDWGGYFNTQYFADPKEQVIGIIMKQTSGSVNDNTGWKFRQMVGQAIDD
ncbi:MAG: serine hydrolase domain-containing protein [Cyclobacteriaceae bacterium]